MQRIKKAWRFPGLKNYDAAIEAFDLAIQYVSEHANAHYHKGLALFTQGKYEKAIRSFKHALDHDPSIRDALFHTGLAYAA